MSDWVLGKTEKGIYWNEPGSCGMDCNWYGDMMIYCIDLLVVGKGSKWAPKNWILA